MTSASTPDAPITDAQITDTLLSAERDIISRLGDQPFDFAAMHAIQNIYRAATAVRRTAERTLLADYGLSWGRLTILWVLWVWESMETARLAEECDMAKGTLTGVLTTLERQGLVTRARMKDDKRRVMVDLTEKGRSTIEEVYPLFNGLEADLCSGLTRDDQAELARMLRQIITESGDQTA